MISRLCNPNSYDILQKTAFRPLQQKIKVEEAEVPQKPTKLGVETTRKADVDNIIILVCTWRWQVRIADLVAHRTSHTGKTSELVVQTWGHRTQFELTPIKEKTVDTDDTSIVSKTLSSEKVMKEGKNPISDKTFACQHFQHDQEVFGFI